MFSKFNDDAQKALLGAKKEMQKLKHLYVGSEHLLLSLLKNCDSIKKKFFDYNIDYKNFKERLINIVGIGEEKSDWFIYTPLLKKILETAMYVAKESNDDVVSCDILVFSILEENEGIALKILNSYNIDLMELQDSFSNKILMKKSSQKSSKLINEFGIDLCEKARNNNIDPVIGREDEIKQIIQVLCRKNKNNPLLIGEAGVGKTAIVEELAKLIVNNNVPNRLKNKRLILLSIASLVAGTKYRGEFEERITNLISEVEEDDSIILFIDEIHTLMGAGGAEGAIDAANIFKPSLARGKLKLIGATTIQEYKKSILKDKAIDRRFQIINIEEPNNDKVVDILLKLKPLYESFHNVCISDELIRYIVELSGKYIHDRYQPDKSIDILDEVCSLVSLKKSSNNSKLNNYNLQLADILEKKKKCILNENFLEAANLRKIEKDLYSKINKLELRKSKVKNNLTVTKNDIISVVNKKTKIPIYDFDISLKKDKFVTKLEQQLKNSIKGQDNAISELVNYTKRNIYGLNNSNLPASFLFVGPSGVGKTLLASTFSDLLFGKDNIIRLDMSEYRDLNSISKIIGSNPGYVGYDDCSNVLEEIKNKPYSVILLDEIEKANSAVLNLFLQILDYGKITDSKGNTIFLNNNIIIMTSNIGFCSNNIGFNNSNCLKSNLKDTLSIELINRINCIIKFNDFDNYTIKSICKKSLDNLILNYKEKNVVVKYNSDVIEEIVSLSEFKQFGARKIDKIINDKINNYIIDLLLNGKKDIYIDSILCKEE